MKRLQAILFAALLGGAAIVGCGSGSGTSAADACGGPDCATDPVLRQACETEFNRCVDRGIDVNECVAGAEAVCG